MDKNTVDALPRAAIDGSASPIICGFTAINAMAGLAGTPSFTCTPVPRNQSLGYGSKTQMAVGDKPPDNHPASIADPILPQPKRTMPRSSIAAIDMKKPSLHCAGS
jgi:hypothetical protein